MDQSNVDRMWRADLSLKCLNKAGEQEAHMRINVCVYIYIYVYVYIYIYKG